jgi:hypothetical protein
VRRLLSVIVALFALSLAACSGASSNNGPERPSDGGSPAEVTVAGSSYCQADPVVGNIDYVLKLKNLGGKDAEGIGIKLVHRDAAGDRKAPLGDTLVDVSVPAHATKEVNGTSGLDEGEQVTECAVTLIGAGTDSSDEHRIGVR